MALKNTEIRVGDQVVYYKPDSNGDRLDQPLWGGKHGYIPGIVVDITASSNPVRVKFRNGSIASFRESCLRPYTWKLSFFANFKQRGLWKRVRFYLALAALVTVIDQFILGGRITNMTSRMVEKFVKGILSSTDKMIDKIIPK